MLVQYKKLEEEKILFGWIPHRACGMIRFSLEAEKLLQSENIVIRRVYVAGPTVWNSFPDNLRHPDVTMDNFKRLLKTFLFSAYQCN